MGYIMSSAKRKFFFAAGQTRVSCARRILYYQLYYSSLPFDAYLEEDGIWPGYVRLKGFDWQQLLPENSPALHAIAEGLAGRGNFMLKEEA